MKIKIIVSILIPEVIILLGYRTNAKQKQKQSPHIVKDYAILRYDIF
jgi:hypothetical protein